MVGLFGKNVMKLQNLFKCFRKKRSAAPHPAFHVTFPVEQEGKREEISLSAFEKSTGVKYFPLLTIENSSILAKIKKRNKKLVRKHALSEEQLWNGCYYRKEIESGFFPRVFLRYIDSHFGWGVFAAKNFKKREFLAEYSGNLRRRRRSDRKNSYCFEYLIASGEKTPYVVDAKDQGGIARFINHSQSPNLFSSLANVDGIAHIILLAKRDILEGEQLCYHYGEDFWSCRRSPKDLI